jgi:hypothetical protein
VEAWDAGRVDGDGRGGRRTSSASSGRPVSARRLAFRAAGRRALVAASFALLLVILVRGVFRVPPLGQLLLVLVAGASGAAARAGNGRRTVALGVGLGVAVGAVLAVGFAFGPGVLTGDRTRGAHGDTLVILLLALPLLGGLVGGLASATRPARTRR